MENINFRNKAVMVTNIFISFRILDPIVLQW